jgi:hypothetical protein
MIRNAAISLLYELTTTYNELLTDTTQINLHLIDGETRVIIRSWLDFEQKNALLAFLSKKGLKVVDASSDSGAFECVLIIS